MARNTSGLPGDRRSRDRFPIQLELEYSTADQSGTALVRDMSKSGISFTNSAPLSVGERLTMVIALPPGDSGYRRAMRLNGEVVRTENGCVGARILSRSFLPAKVPKALAAGVPLPWM
jgi:hypothetical protein